MNLVTYFMPLEATTVSKEREKRFFKLLSKAKKIPVSGLREAYRAFTDAKKAEIKEASKPATLSPSDYINFFDDMLNKEQSEFENELELDAFISENKLKIAIVKRAFKSHKEKRISDIKQERYSGLPEILQRHFDLDVPPVIQGKYIYESGMLGYDDDKGTDKLCAMFVPKAQIEIVHEGEAKTYLRLAMKTRTGIREILHPMSTFVKADRFAKVFGNNKVYLDKPRIGKTMTYLADYLANNPDLILDQKGVKRTGWVDDTFYIPQREQGAIWLNKALEKNYTIKGERSTQLELLEEMGKGKVFITALGAFTASLFDLVPTDLNFIIHLGGRTGLGKSFAGKAGLSFYCEPFDSGQKWNTTLARVESYLSENYGVVTLVDDIEDADNVDKAISVSYMFADRKGKGRNRIDEEGDMVTREILSFKGVMISTGEKSWLDVVAQSKRGNDPIGSVRRVLDVPARGIWDGVDKRKVGRLMHSAHGILGVDFLDYLEKNRDRVLDLFDSSVELFSDIVEVGETINTRFGLMTTALRILKEMNFIDETIYTRQFKYLRELAKKSASEFNNAKDIFSKFKDEFVSYLSSDRESYVHLNASGGVVFVGRNPKIFGRINIENDLVEISVPVFNKWCQDQKFPPKEVITELLTRDMLKYNPDSKEQNKRKAKQVKHIGTTNVWSYCIKGLFSPDEVDITFLNPDKEKETRTNEDIQRAIDDMNEQLYGDRHDQQVFPI